MIHHAGNRILHASGATPKPVGMQHSGALDQGQKVLSKQEADTVSGLQLWGG